MSREIQIVITPDIEQSKIDDEGQDPEVMSMAAVELARFNEEIPPESLSVLKAIFSRSRG